MASGNLKSTKDKEMAAYLKKIGHKRTTCRCPICNKIVSLQALYNHIVTHR